MKGKEGMIGLRRVIQSAPTWKGADVFKKLPELFQKLPELFQKHQSLFVYIRIGLYIRWHKPACTYA